MNHTRDPHLQSRVKQQKSQSKWACSRARPLYANLTKPELEREWTLTNKLDQSSVKAPLQFLSARDSPEEKRKSTTSGLQAAVAPTASSTTQSQTNTQQPLSTPIDIGAQQAPDLIARNNIIQRILERVDWIKLSGDTVQAVATFRGLEDAEAKYQEFESFIRAEAKYLNLPEGCKPFERVLIQGNKAGSKPCPYIRLHNFRTQEDVREYHSALSERKVKQQYYPPLRLCYQIQKMRLQAADTGTHIGEDPGETLCGKTAVIEDGDTRRLVTIGGLIQVDNKLYAMTSGHNASSGDDMQGVSGTDSSSGISIDYAEYDVDIESALICGEPETTSDADWQPHPGVHNDQHRSVPESATLRFRGSSMAGDDWSLHLIKDPLLALPNSFPGIDGVITRYMTYPASQPLPGLAWLLAGVSGPRIVHILPGIVSFPLPSGNWISAWKVSPVILGHLEVYRFC